MDDRIQAGRGRPRTALNPGVERLSPATNRYWKDKNPKKPIDSTKELHIPKAATVFTWQQLTQKLRQTHKPNHSGDTEKMAIFMPVA